MAVAPGQLVSLLRRRHGDRQERAAELAEVTRARLKAIVREQGLSNRIWLIGSLAWGGFDESSDVDVVVRDLSEGQLAWLWHHLEHGLRLPVDVLRLEELPEDFRIRVLSEGMLIDVA